MVLCCACFACLKAPTKFSFKNFKAYTELKTTIIDPRSVAFHPARNLRRAATKERLTTKEASINGSCSLNFVELSHCFFVCLFVCFFPILSWQTLLSLFIPMAFLSKKKMLSGGLEIILRPFDKAYIKGTQSAMWPHWPGHYFCQFEKRLPQPEIKSTRQKHLEIRFNPA